MADSLPALAKALKTLSADDTTYATDFVETLLQHARESTATDVHVQPLADGLEISFRLDGALQQIGVFPPGQASNVVARLKVLSGLLTYKTETPQEGRLAAEGDNRIEMRVSTFPTLHGERAVVRLFNQQQRFRRIADLGLAPDATARLEEYLHSPSGALIIAGPAGSGKTTTAYACLREIAERSSGKRCIVTLEDPIEAAIDGVVQSQVRASAGFDLDVGLRSLVRQDPEVLMVGEIRDPFAAETVINASLTGHLVLSTFHAEDGAGAVSRLLEMGIAPYLVRSGVRAIVSQRLVRSVCVCGEWSDDEADRIDLAVARWKRPNGCEHCQGSGYRGRQLLAEFFSLDSNPVRDAILARGDRSALTSAGRTAGLRPLLDVALRAVEAGATTPAEVRRVFGFFSPTDVNRVEPG